MKRLAALLLAGGCSSITGTQPDAEPEGCLLQTSFIDPVALDQHAEAAGDYVGLTGVLDTGHLIVFSLELYAGSGAFADDPIAPGTYTAEDQYATCGVCALLYPGYENGHAQGTYLATAGNVMINSVSPRLSGAVSNLELMHVDLDDDLESTPAMDGCVTTVTSLIFDAEVTR